MSPAAVIILIIILPLSLLILALVYEKVRQVRSRNAPGSTQDAPAEITSPTDPTRLTLPNFSFTVPRGMRVTADKNKEMKSHLIEMTGDQSMLDEEIFIGITLLKYDNKLDTSSALDIIKLASRGYINRDNYVVGTATSSLFVGQPAVSLTYYFNESDKAQNRDEQTALLVAMPSEADGVLFIESMFDSMAVDTSARVKLVQERSDTMLIEELASNWIWTA